MVDGGALLETKQGGGSLTFQWLAGILLGLVVTAGSFVLNTVQARITAQEIEVRQIREDLQQRELREERLRASIDQVKAAQDRQNKLLVKIAKRMGIEVAE
jgi:hypothetical protein